MITEFSELEYKYEANNVGLEDFTKLMETIHYEKKLTVSSWDFYFTNNINDNFIRLRESPHSPELTIKRKTDGISNWNRQEVDIPLSSYRYNRKIIEKFVELEGYSENFRIYKSCFIYWSELLNYSYYIVYDENLREKARFIEIEINKNRVKSIDFPVELLNLAEKKLEILNISSKNRLNKSLFEIFRKETV